MTEHADCPNCGEHAGLSCEYHSEDYNKGMSPEKIVTSVWKCFACDSIVFVTTPRKK